MKKILFYYGNNLIFMNRLGEEAATILSCYTKAKELGYDDITIEWPRVKYTHPTDNDIRILFEPIECQSIPIRFISKSDISFYEYDRVVNLDEDNSLYDGYLSANPQVGVREHSGFYEYLNKRYIETNHVPMIESRKDESDINILFQYRNSAYGKIRNSSIKEIRNTINLLDSLLKGKKVVYHIIEDYHCL